MSVQATGIAGGVIDTQGFRANVGIILADSFNRLFWARRKGQSGWQFPQGGIQERETPEQTLYRELAEEIGLGSKHVAILGRTHHWLRYRLPQRYRRHTTTPLCIGQKQLWFLLRFKGDDTAVRLDLSDTPEFDSWRWVDFWQPVQDVIYFKRRIYRQALTELGPFLFPQGMPEAAV